MAAGVLRRVPKAAAAHTAQSVPLSVRIEEWLVLWGDWVRAYRARQEVDSDLKSHTFRDVASPRQWESTLEVLESLRLEDRTLRGIDSCVSELPTALFLLTHWHYARALNRRAGAKVFRSPQIPEEGSAEYEDRLTAARNAVAAKALAKRVLIPE